MTTSWIWRGDSHDCDHHVLGDAMLGQAGNELPLPSHCSFGCWADWSIAILFSCRWTVFAIPFGALLVWDEHRVLGIGVAS